MNEESLFARLVKLSEQERRQALEQQCADAPELRQRIEALLEANDADHSLLNAVDAAGVTTTTSESIGRKHPIIGNYKLLHKLGEGGFGVVYMAEQLRPVRRKVALKIVKTERLGDATGAIARFEAERQALAMMDHPNIATVFDGGSIPADQSDVSDLLGNVERPYFVMELVNGVPITEYCDKNKLTTGERLELFTTVCQAVQHAHQKGVIHRDLKPSNILVTLHDGVPVVKVIDFGVAKAINQQLTEKTLYTVLGDMIGTPLYMSPEQAERSGLDTDTRSDIYSLGVLLYELLTGTTPLSPADLKEAGLLQIQRRIVDSEPPKPSTRLSTSGEKLTVIAKHRSISPDRLHRELRGDLDWIVMKALEKDRTRRYDTALGFAKDVQRYLDGDFVEARPPSSWYRTTKFCRQHAPIVASTAVVLVALTAGLVAALDQRRIADDERSRAEKQTQLVIAERNRAQNLLASLTDELINKGLNHALNGEADSTEKTILEIESLAPDSPWPEMLRGQLALYGTDTITALGHLRKALQIAPGNLSARAMYGSALIFNGSIDEYRKQRPSFMKPEPVGALEELFVGQAVGMLMDNESSPLALRYLQSSLHKRKSFMAYAIRAQIKGHEALDHADAQLAESALRDIDAARLGLPDNPFVNMIYASVNHTGYQLGLSRCNREDFIRMLDSLPDMRQYGIGHLVVGWCYEEVGLLDKAEASYLTGSRFGDWWAAGACSQLKRGDPRSARMTAKASTSNLELDRNNPINRKHYQWIADIVEGVFDPKQVVSIAADTDLSDHELSTIISCLLIDQEYDQAIRLADSRDDPSVRDSLISFRHLRGEHSVDSVADEFPNSSSQRTWAYHSIGLAHFARGEMTKAREFFNATLDSKNFFVIGYWDAQMMLALMDQGLLPQETIAQK